MTTKTVHPSPVDMARERCQDRGQDPRETYAAGVAAERARVKADMAHRAAVMLAQAHEAIRAARTSEDVTRTGQMTGEAKSLREYAEGLA